MSKRRALKPWQELLLESLEYDECFAEAFPCDPPGDGNRRVNPHIEPSPDDDPEENEEYYDEDPR